LDGTEDDGEEKDYEEKDNEEKTAETRSNKKSEETRTRACRYNIGADLGVVRLSGRDHARRSGRTHSPHGE
jgi:hypothetical protein